MIKFKESRSTLFKYSRIIITVLIAVSFLLSSETFSYWATSIQGSENQTTMTFTIGEYIREVTDYVFSGGLSSGDVIVTSESDDTVDIGGRVQNDASLDTGAGNDTVTVDGRVEDTASVDTGAGDDTVTLLDSIRDDAILNTGDGNDVVNVFGSLLGRAVIETGNDDDTIYIQQIGNRYTGTVDAGAGDDTVTITTVRKNTATIDGGAGYDILYLENYTISQWNSSVGEDFIGFEMVVLIDGIIYP